MKCMLVLFVLSLLFQIKVHAQVFGIGKPNISNIDAIIIIKGQRHDDLNVDYHVAVPKSQLSTTVIHQKKGVKVIFAWGSSGSPIAEITFDTSADALDVLSSIYPKNYCLDENGVSKCTTEKILGIIKE